MNAKINALRVNATKRWVGRKNGGCGYLGVRAAGKKSVACVGIERGCKGFVRMDKVAGGGAIFCVKALFLVTFFEPAKKVTPPGGHEIKEGYSQFEQK